MAYVPTQWNDNSNPPISAANLNKLEQAVKTAHDGLDLKADKNAPTFTGQVAVTGSLTVGGQAVWHSGNLVVSSTPPANPTIGMIWIDTSVVLS